MVQIRIPTVLRPHVGGAASVQAAGGTIAEVFDSLTSEHPSLRSHLLNEDGSLHKFVNVYRNDDDIRYLEQLGTGVSDGDVVSILPAVAGG